MSRNDCMGNLHIEGACLLETWRRCEADDQVAYPLGKNPEGILICSPDGQVAVQTFEAERPRIDSLDPLAGPESERAGAYSPCLAYFGRYEIDGDTVIHELDGSLYPKRAGTSQLRPAPPVGNRLVLHVVDDATGKVTHEIAWRRPDAGSEDPAKGLDQFVRTSVLWRKT